MRVDRVIVGCGSRRLKLRVGTPALVAAGAEIVAGLATLDMAG